jgi:predicted nuclease of predicted toxin-antitoxin system
VVVRALRSADHDVLAIAEVSPREEDQEVMERAVREDRLLITEDKDFGQLVYAKMERWCNFYPVPGPCTA